jgi:hypothetical protein
MATEAPYAVRGTTGSRSIAMKAVTLERLRLACVLLFVLVAVVAFGDYVQWWRIDGLRGASFLLLIALGLAIVVIKDNLPDAWKKTKEEQRAKQERKARELGERRSAMRTKALAVAEADYSDHLEEGALWQRGWWQEGDESNLIGRYLEPADVVLRYNIEGDDQNHEIRLYARQRVDHAEAAEPEVMSQLRENLRTRERERQRLLEEEAEAQRQAKDAAEEAARAALERKEVEEREARQRIIHIDDRLKS